MRSVLISYFAWLCAFVSISVTPGRTRLVGSRTDPENVENVCAGARPAISSVDDDNDHGGRDASGPRDRAAVETSFNMALNLLSRLDGRAMAGAGNRQTRAALALSDRASASRCVA